MISACMAWVSLMLEWLSQFVMQFPTGGVGAVEELDDADAFFKEAAGEDAVLGVFFFEVGAGVGAVLFMDGGGLVGEVHHFGNGDLHFACEFVAGDAGREVGVTGVFFEMAAVEAL